MLDVVGERLPNIWTAMNKPANPKEENHDPSSFAAS
jgi:hypothetical protein